MKTRLFYCLLLLFAQTAAAQSIADRFIAHRGFAFGILTAQPAKYSFLNPGSTSPNTTTYTSSTAVSFGLNWGARFNVVEFSEEKSISLHVDAVGSSYVTTNLFSPNSTVSSMSDAGLILQIPITVNYNMGHLATRLSTANNGFGFGFGIEINRMSSYFANEEAPFYQRLTNATFEMGAVNFIQPVVNLGYRYWNRNDKARELNLQFGFGARDGMSFGTFGRPTVRLSMHKFINY